MGKESNAAAQRGTTPSFRNSNRWDTRQLVVMGLLCAIGVLLSFVEFPIFPAAPWLKYDASFVAYMVAGFAYGPGAGLAVGITAIVIHGLMDGNLWGAVMNILVLVGFLWPAAVIYMRKRTLGRAVVGLLVGCVCALAMAIVGNIVVTPIYSGMPREAVMDLILPVLLPFNAMKAGLNTVLILAVYKSISLLIKPQRR